mgnify:CR=1 FL=1
MRSCLGLPGTLAAMYHESVRPSSVASAMSARWALQSGPVVGSTSKTVWSCSRSWTSRSVCGVALPPGLQLASQLLSMLPYLATIVVLVLISRNANFIKVNMPASIGKPFFPGS